MTPDTLLRRLAGALVSHPMVYDLVQALAGQARVAKRLRAAIPAPVHAGRFLDVGSSAGAFVRRLDIAPVCIDVDLRALIAARRWKRSGQLVGGDAARLPFRELSFDVTLCVFVSHHLTDTALDAAISEIARVTAGHLVFLDATRDDRRRVSRWMWRYDRGSYPRSAGALLAAVGSKFEPVRVEEFSLYHRYLLCVAKPRSTPGSPSGGTKSSAA